MTSQILGMRPSVLTGAILVASVLFAGPVEAQTQSPSALAGKVTSQEEGAMEGVLVSAKRAGSTMTITVVSDSQGQYSSRVTGWIRENTPWRSGPWDISCRAPSRRRWR
jgi:hypothetical protein